MSSHRDDLIHVRTRSLSLGCLLECPTKWAVPGETAWGKSEHRAKSARQVFRATCSASGLRALWSPRWPLQTAWAPAWCLQWLLECVATVQGFQRGLYLGLHQAQASSVLVLQCLGCSCQVPADLKVQGAPCRNTQSPHPSLAADCQTANQHVPQAALHRGIPWESLRMIAHPAHKMCFLYQWEQNPKEMLRLQRVHRSSKRISTPLVKSAGITYRHLRANFPFCKQGSSPLQIINFANSFNLYRGKKGTFNFSHPFWQP